MKYKQVYEYKNGVFVRHGRGYNYTRKRKIEVEKFDQEDFVKKLNYARQVLGTSLR